jgi:hypothetical protein
MTQNKSKRQKMQVSIRLKMFFIGECMIIKDEAVFRQLYSFTPFEKRLPNSFIYLTESWL